MHTHSSSRFLFIFIILILGMSAVGSYIITSNQSPAKVSDSPVIIETPTTTTQSASTEQPITAKRNALSYSQAINLYSKNRIQFDSYCQANPTSLTIKSTVPLMLDNRSDSPRSITVDGTTYSLLPYGFKVITISFSRLPHTAVIHCGSSKNSARVNVVR